MAVGDTVTITTRGGKSWDARVSKIVWDGDDVTLVSTSSLGTAPTKAVNQPATRAGGRCRDCREPIRDAPHHRAMGGLCGTCAFDEYDC